MLIIIAIIGSALFVIGSILDARYSSGQREQNSLFRSSRGYFDALRYWLISGLGAGLSWLLTLYYPHWSMYVATGGVLGYLGGYRLIVALKTGKALKG